MGVISGARCKALAAGAALSVALTVAVSVPARADTLIPIPLPTLTIPVPTLVPAVDVLEATLLIKLNAERLAAGLQPLATQPWAQSVARAHSQDMAAARSIWHNHAGYLDIAKQTINAYLSGENVAEAGTLDEADTLLTTSPPHRANILYPAFNYVGIGVALDYAGYVYVTQDFVTIRPASAVRTRAATPAIAAPTQAAVPAAAPSHTRDSALPPAPATPPAPVAAAAPAAPPAATASPMPSTRPFTGAPVAAARHSPTWPLTVWVLAAAELLGVSGTWFVRRRQGPRGTR